MASPDIRAGMALLIAALAADGESQIHNIIQSFFFFWLVVLFFYDG